MHKNDLKSVKNTPRSDTETICKEKVTNPVNYLTVFEGELTNLEAPLKCTLIGFKSVIENDLYLKHFKDSEKESIDEFLVC